MLEKGGLLYMVLIPTIKGPMVEKRIHGGAKGTSVIDAILPRKGIG